MLGNPDPAQVSLSNEVVDRTENLSADPTRQCDSCSAPPGGRRPARNSSHPASSASLRACKSVSATVLIGFSSVLRIGPVTVSSKSINAHYQSRSGRLPCVDHRQNRVHFRVDRVDSRIADSFDKVALTGRLDLAIVTPGQDDFRRVRNGLPGRTDDRLSARATQRKRPQGRGPGVLNCPSRLAACLAHSHTLDVPGAYSSHQGWSPRCEFSSPAEPVTSARRSSPCSWSRDTASASSTRSSSAATACLPCCSNRFFELIKGDVCDPAAVKTALDGIDAVIHLAAIVGYPACKKEPQRRPGDQRRGDRQPAAPPQARPEGHLRLDRQHLRLDPRLRLQRRNTPRLRSRSTARPRPPPSRWCSTPATASPIASPPPSASATGCGST